MLPEWLMAMLVLLNERWSTRRDAHVRLLKLQVEILRSRLPGNRVILDPVERRRLMKVGAEVDHASRILSGLSASRPIGDGSERNAPAESPAKSAGLG